MGPEITEDVIRQVLNLQSVSRPDPAISAIARNASLTICRVLAEAHQGRLELSSSRMQGTTARILLPKERMIGGAQRAPVAVAATLSRQPISGAA